MKFHWSTQWVFRKVQDRNLLVDVKAPCRLAEVSQSLVMLVKNSADTSFSDVFDSWVKSYGISDEDQLQAIDTLRVSGIIISKE